MNVFRFTDEKEAERMLKKHSIILSERLTPYQKKVLYLLFASNLIVECYLNLTKTFRILSRKGVPLSFTPSSRVGYTIVSFTLKYNEHV